MSTLETVGWISGIIIAIIGIISWAIDDIPQEIRIGIAVIAVIILVLSGVWHKKNESKKGKDNVSNEKSAFPILPQFRKDYHNHIDGLFKEIKKNLNPLRDDHDYFEALRKTKEKKRMIFQHLRTTDLLSDTYSHLFAMYKVSVTELNDLEKRKKEIVRHIEDYDKKLNSYEFGHNEDEWIDVNDFKKAIGIKRNDSTEDFFKNKPLYEFPSSINCNLYVKEENNEFKIGFAGHWFARSKDKEKLEQFKDFIYENGRNIMEEVSSILSVEHTIYLTSVPWFNKEFKEHDEALEGEPMLGSCFSCLNWFNVQNVKKYKPILDEFNSNMSNYEESIWAKNKD